jgi:hypothetical protein
MVKQGDYELVLSPHTCLVSEAPECAFGDYEAWRVVQVPEGEEALRVGDILFRREPTHGTPLPWNSEVRVIDNWWALQLRPKRR